MYETADSDKIADLEIRHFRPDFRNTPDDLVPGNGRIYRLHSFPFGTSKVKVRVANAAVLNVDLYIDRTQVAAFNCVQCQRSVCRGLLRKLLL